METATAVAILTLFTGIELKGGALVMRPFDVVVAFMGLLLVLKFARRQVLVVPSGLLLLFPYFIIHTMSALTLGLGNGFREAIQVGVLVAFGLGAASQPERMDFKRVCYLLIAGLILITVVNVGWHISHGYTTGWKRLDDPKMAFTILPMLVAIAAIVRRAPLSVFFWAGWALLGLLVLLSGERKALLVFALLTAILASRGRLALALPAVGVVTLMVTMAVSVMSDSYLTRQLGSIYQMFSGDFTAYNWSLWATGESPGSFSNAQRIFAFRVGIEMFAENPIFGVGTNGYQAALTEQYQFAPGYLVLSIHNEFFRVLVENGIVGLVAYGMVWIISVYRAIIVARNHYDVFGLERRTFTSALIVFYVPLFAQCFFEASGTPNMLILVIVALSPDFLRYSALMRARNLATEGVAADQVPKNVASYGPNAFRY